MTPRPMRAVLAVVGLLGAWALVVAVVDLLDVAVVEAGWRRGLVLAATVLAAVLGATAVGAARRAPRLAAGSVVGAASVLLVGLSAAGLHGSRWGWFGLYSDSAFRTQMATRYAEHVALVDYGYRDLPAYYPPLVGWLQGRVSDLTGLAGWESVQPVQLVLAGLTPLLAYALWRQVTVPLLAAAVAALTAVWTAHPQKPDEWLVLSCLVPWWLLAVRDTRAPGVPRRPAWLLGVVLGLLLLVHTFYFLPMGVATLLALALDAVRRRRRGTPPRLPWPRSLVIGLVGVAVAAPYWVGAVAARLRLPSDDLQMRFSVPAGNIPPFPVPTDPLGVAGLAGLVWLVVVGGDRWRSGRPADRADRVDRADRADGVDEADRADRDLAGGLALALAGAVLTMGLGALAARHDIGLLTFKTRDLVTALLVTAAVVGAHQVLMRSRRVLPGRVVVAATTLLAVAGAAGAAHHFATHWATGTPALVAQTTRYPDGSFPEGRRGLGTVIPTLFVREGDPAVEEVRDAWRELSPLPIEEAVLVTSRVDLLATTPTYGFLAVKSIYSHPNGQWEARHALLREVAACPDPACAARLLRDNPYDAVDGLVLERDGEELLLRLKVDAFPDRTRSHHVVLPSAVLTGPEFRRRDLGRLTLVAVVPERE